MHGVVFMKTDILFTNPLSNCLFMTAHNKIQKRYFKKIEFYFVYDWIFLSGSIITFVYFLLNYYFKNSFLLFNIPRLEALIWAMSISIIFIIKYFISSKLRARLIIEIIEDSGYYLLTVYNKSVVRLDRAFIPLERQKADYFINTLFSNKMGTIHLYKKQSERFIVKIDNKKYYLVPPLFENEVLI